MGKKTPHLQLIYIVSDNVEKIFIYFGVISNGNSISAIFKKILAQRLLYNNIKTTKFSKSNRFLGS